MSMIDTEKYIFSPFKLNATCFVSTRREETPDCDGDTRIECKELQKMFPFNTE